MYKINIYNVGDRIKFRQDKIIQVDGPSFLINKGDIGQILFFDSSVIKILLDKYHYQLDKHYNNISFFNSYGATNKSLSNVPLSFLTEINEMICLDE